MTSTLGSNLGCKRRALARALETTAASRSPAQRVALPVSDRDDRVVERGMDMGDAIDDMPLTLFPRLVAAAAAVSASGHPGWYPVFRVLVS